MKTRQAIRTALQNNLKNFFFISPASTTPFKSDSPNELNTGMEEYRNYYTEATRWK